MPRLLGKQSNAGSYMLFGFLLGLAIGIAGMSEYTGIIDVVPRFGKQGKNLDSLRSLNRHKLIIYTDYSPISG